MKKSDSACFALFVALLAGCAPLANAPVGQAPDWRVPDSVIDVSHPSSRREIGRALRKTELYTLALDDAGFHWLPDCTIHGLYTSSSLDVRSEEGPTDQVFASAEAFEQRLSGPRLVTTTESKHNDASAPAFPVLLTTHKSEEWNLGALDTNQLPATAACSRATHVVVRALFGHTSARTLPAQTFRANRGLGTFPYTTPVGLLTLEAKALGRKWVVDEAAPVHLKPKPGEAWSLRNGEDSVCVMPCDKWIPPGSRLTLRRSDGLTLSMSSAIADAAERDVAITSGRDPTYPWAGLGLAAGGAAFTALSVGLLSGASGGRSWAPSWPSGSSGPSGSSSAAGGAGILVIPALAALLDVWSVVYFIKGGAVPKLDVRKTTRAKLIRKANSLALTLSPGGVGMGVSF
jgi:hypothetical protein